MKNYSKIITFIAGFALIVSFAFAPAFTFAKEKENRDRGENERKEQKREERSEKKERRDKKERKSCFKAFGHLIATGWIKKNGQASTTDSTCDLPFGIKHHFYDENGSTTPIVRTDTVPPVISSIVSVTGTTSVQVGWITNEFASSRVYYSASSTVDVNATSTAFVDKSSLDKNHLVNVTGLTASTTYYFVVESTDASGNVSRSAVFSASTGTSTPIVDTTAPTISNAVAVVGTTTIQLSWNTNENGTSKAYYSTTSPVDVNASSTLSVSDATLVTAHAMTVSGLATSTQYYMILESKDSSGNAGRTAQFTFTTAN